VHNHNQSGISLASFSADSPLKAHEPIEIPNSRGGFDYLQVDNVKRRLLLDHTGNGTLDIVDLKTEKLLKQIKTARRWASRSIRKKDSALTSRQ